MVWFVSKHVLEKYRTTVVGTCRARVLPCLINSAIHTSFSAETKIGEEMRRPHEYSHSRRKQLKRVYVIQE